jgi:predicted dehydrogenase
MGPNVAAIGTGLLGCIECRIYRGIRDVKLVAGADVSEDAREEFASQFDCPVYGDHSELLAQHGSELDAVNVVTPHTLHYEHVRACLEADLHVFVEKPLTTDVTEAIDLINLADERNRILQVGYQRRFDPPFVELKSVVDEGRLGRLHTATCFLGQAWLHDQDDSWRTDPALSGGGQLYDSGSHLLDALVWTTGATPKTVTAVIDDEDSVDIHTALAMTLERDGSPVTAGVTVTGDGSGSDPTEGLVLWGTEGRASLLDGSLRIESDDGPAYVADVDSLGFEELTARKLEAFVEAIRNEGQPPVPPTLGATVTALTEAAYEAWETRSHVDVATINRENGKAAARSR